MEVKILILTIVKLIVFFRCIVCLKVQKQNVTMVIRMPIKIGSHHNYDFFRKDLIYSATQIFVETNINYGMELTYSAIFKSDKVM